MLTGTTFSRVSYDIPGNYQRFARARALRDAEDRAARRSPTTSRPGWHRSSRGYLRCRQWSRCADPRSTLPGAARSGAADRPGFGPDAGLVRERADALIASAVDDPTDPFALVRIDGDELSAEPSRLVEEAHDHAAVRRPPRDPRPGRLAQLRRGVETLAERPAQGLPHRDRGRRPPPESPLRKICERAKTAVAIACYADTASAISRLIDEEMRAQV